MSLAKTLMKVAIGVAVAKGVSTLAKRASAGAGAGSGSSGSTSGGLGDLMGDLLGTSGKGTSATRTTTRGTSSGGGGLLDEVLGNGRSTTRSSRSTAPKGGLDGVLEQMTGARTGRGGQGSGGIGDLLGAVLGGTSAASTVSRSSGGNLRLDPVEREQEISAALMLKAIIQAVKCDGDLDADEKRKLMEAMGDSTQDEVQAVNAELSAPVDVDALVRMVPNGMEAEVYMASLSAINLDQQAEAQYLHSLAQALELTPQEVNALHDRIGAPKFYS